MCAFVVEEEYDSESIEADPFIFAQNVAVATKVHSIMINGIKLFLRHQRISARSFSTGILFWYWPHYRGVDEEALKKETLFSVMEFGAHSVAETCVSAHFESLKAEVLGSRLIGVADFKEHVVDKAGRFEKSAKCKAMTSNPFGGKLGEDPLHFGIANGSALSAQHLQTVILYCDFSDYCTAFSVTFRKKKWNERIEETAKRNGRFYWVSRRLREVVAYYGCAGHEKYAPIDDESGPFFTGMSFELNIPSFSIGLQGPTSTSKQKEIALRFAGTDGMLIRLNNEIMPSDCEPFWNSVWISCYPEEDERFFFGSIVKLQLETLVLVESANNYKQSIGAFYKFDAALSGAGMDGVSVSRTEFELIDSCIKSVFGEPVLNKKLDAFILDNFYAFSQHKTRILMGAHVLVKVANKSFVDLIMHPISKQGADDVSDGATNLFKPLLLKLFPKLTQITICTSMKGVYALNLLSLLSLLDKAELPRSWQSIVIKDYTQSWLKDSFSVETQHMYAAKGFKMKLEIDFILAEEAGKKQDLISITAL